MSSGEKQTLLEFPCRFPIKAIGSDKERFEDTVIAIVEAHTGKLADNDVRTAPSRNGNFVSVTVTITAESQAQLDDIYRALSAHDDILVSL